MISVEEALGRILAAVTPTPPEVVSLSASVGRVLAEDVVARLTQPPTAVSAMDGYAVRACDAPKAPIEFTVIGEAPAGGAYAGTVGAHQAVRIFTGGPVPNGGDAIIIQEDIEVLGGGRIRSREAAQLGRHIRRAGIDFKEGAVGVKAGKKLTPRDVGLAAAMNVPWLSVRRKPRIAILATGDELKRAGEPIGPNQIVSSNSVALAALVESNGGVAIDLGIARDNEDSLKAMAAGAAGADILVTIGGASVGDHDLVQQVLGREGLAVDFWKIAMRPGKPLIFGHIGKTAMIGLPGNPVSALVCGLVYLIPAMRRLQGVEGDAEGASLALLGRDLQANDRRQDYLRASLAQTEKGEIATPFALQDSSVLSDFARADCLVVRPPNAPAAQAGDPVRIIRLADYPAV